ncbi:hypothetical protein SAMN02745181_3250 [Rubritalea squalenifaciens DSM 18772]|uniref:Lipoprotein n=2 Tax=Rubritalea squalenifaciens TaxID=407226 RepID=A0A1M6PP18_9BACT|nr:hypothetical protein SAMN02745181_3250 [Rubritalea squalenifaciens DSM 18772]
MQMKLLLLPLAISSFAISCTSTKVDYFGETLQEFPKPTWRDAKEVNRVNKGLAGTVTYQIYDHKATASLSWRKYDATKDANIKEWVGDMGTPPPAYVLDKLTLSVDGASIAVPKSKYQFICSQWKPNGAGNTHFIQRDGLGCLLVTVGDGGEAYSVVYVFDPVKKTLVYHSVEDGPSVDNQIIY